MTTATQTRQQAIEAAVGEPVAALHNPDWQRYLKEGCIVDLHIQRWRATTMLDFADLGFFFDDEASDSAASRYVHAGSRLLLPQSILHRARAIESKARWVLRPPIVAGAATGGRVFAFRTAWGSYVPVALFAEWKAQFLSAQTEYYQLRDDLFANYESLKAEVEREYVDIARDAFTRLFARNPALTLDGVEASTLAWVRSNIPTAEVLRDSFRFTYNLSYIPMPTDIARDQANAEVILLDKERSRALRGMQAEIAAQEAEAKARVISDFEVTVRSQLYGWLYGTLQSLIDSAHKLPDAKPNQRIAARVEAIRRQIQALDIFGDKPLQAQLTALRSKTQASPADVAQAAAELRIYVQEQLGSVKAMAARLGREELVADVPGMATAKRPTRTLAAVEDVEPIGRRASARRR